MYKEVHVMMDLETIGLYKNAVITRIAAVVFNIDTGETFEEIDLHVNSKSCVKAGLRIDGETIAWWLKGEESALTETFIPSLTGGLELRDALDTFTNWIEKLKKNYDTYNVQVWGNGACADNTWMMSAYDALHMTVPWKFTHDRDLRTLVYLGEKLVRANHKREMTFTGTRHNPLHDCHHQIKYAVEIMNSIKRALGISENVGGAFKRTMVDTVKEAEERHEDQFCCALHKIYKERADEAEDADEAKTVDDNGENGQDEVAT